LSGSLSVIKSGVNHVDRLLVIVEMPGADDQAMDDLTTQLRLELQDAGAAEAPGDGVVAPGVRGIDPVAVGEFILAVAGGAKAVRDVIEVIRNWRSRSSKAKVRIKLDDRTIVITEDGVVEISGGAGDEDKG
jgi:hypothetical protein